MVLQAQEAAWQVQLEMISGDGAKGGARDRPSPGGEGERWAGGGSGGLFLRLEGLVGMREAPAIASAGGDF